MKQKKRVFKGRFKRSSFNAQEVDFRGESLSSILASRRRVMLQLLAHATNEGRRQEIRRTFQEGDERFKQIFAQKKRA